MREKQKVCEKAVAKCPRAAKQRSKAAPPASQRCPDKFLPAASHQRYYLSVTSCAACFLIDFVFVVACRHVFITVICICIYGMNIKILCYMHAKAPCAWCHKESAGAVKMRHAAMLLLLLHESCCYPVSPCFHAFYIKCHCSSAIMPNVLLFSFSFLGFSFFD